MEMLVWVRIEIFSKFVSVYHTNILYLIVEINAGYEVWESGLRYVEFYYVRSSYKVLYNDISLFDNFYRTLFRMMIDFSIFKQKFWYFIYYRKEMFRQLKFFHSTTNFSDSFDNYELQFVKKTHLIVTLNWTFHASQHS